MQIYGKGKQSGPKLKRKKFGRGYMTPTGCRVPRIFPYGYPRLVGVSPTAGPGGIPYF
jgi:hypothetical protein